MEAKPPEVLDDIRKKRLAYFETSVKHSSLGQSSLANANSNQYQPSDALPDKHGGTKNSGDLQQKNIGRVNHKDSINETSENIENELPTETVTFDVDMNKRKADVLESKKHRENKSFREITDSNIDVKRTTTTKTDYVEDKVKSSFKTTSFFISAEETGNSKNSSSNTNAGNKNIPQADINQLEKETIDKRDVRDSKHVHYDDGYNETVERLIKATKEELLGKQVEDDIWSSFRKQQRDGATSSKVHINLTARRDSEPVFQESPFYSNFEPRRHSAVASEAVNKHSGTVDDLFQVNITHSALHTNLSLNESHQSLNIKLDKYEDLEDLGLSTHRPGSGKRTDELTIESHGIKLNESLTRQLRYALGEEKFQEFLEKSKKDIDVLQQERVSARSESGKKKNEKFDKTDSAKVLEVKDTENTTYHSPSEKKQNGSNVTEDFAPRNGEAVHAMIGEHVLKKKEPRQKLTSNPAYKPKKTENTEISDSSFKASITKKAVPDLNLTGLHESPRPLLHRPKHEPYNIYQDKVSKQAERKAEIKSEVTKEPTSGKIKNYEQVTVSRNVVYSADEIYYQAYGKYPDSVTEPSVAPESSHGIQMSPQGGYVVMNSQGTVSVQNGLLINNQGQSVTPHEIPLMPQGVLMSPHDLPQTPHDMPVSPQIIPSSAKASSGTVPLNPHYSSSFTPVEIRPVSVPSTLASQKYFSMPVPPQFINGHFAAIPDHRGPAVFAPAVSAQNVVTSGSIQLPHPPSQPCPPYTSSGHISTYSMAVGASSSLHYSTAGFPSEHQWIPQASLNQKNYPVQQGVTPAGFQMAYSYPYPVMVMTPHPPTEPVTHAEVCNRAALSDKATGSDKTTMSEKAKVADKAQVEEKSTITDKVEEETTFTSVSQIQPPEDEIKVPHPPEAMKEGKKRSPRKVAVPDRAAKRHIDGIRQHHEQRRQQQEDETLTETQIVEKQRKFAKASIERYFQSLENLYKPSPNSNLDGISDVLSETSDEIQHETLENEELVGAYKNNKDVIDNDELSETFQMIGPNNFCIEENSNEIWSGNDNDHMVKELKEVENYGKSANHSKHDVVIATSSNPISKTKLEVSDPGLDGETLVNTEITGYSVDAGGLTERLNELGINSKYVKGELINSEKSHQQNEDREEGQKIKKGKLLIICPECEGFNKEYMSWCTHCGEMIIGVEPMLVSKNKHGKIRKKALARKSKEIDSIKSLNDGTHNVDKLNKTNDTQYKAQTNDEMDEKPLKLDLRLIKTDSPKEVSDTKLNISPNKSDGKDSGRPSSDDQELLLNRTNKIEQEVEDDICNTITDPVIQDYVRSHFAKRRQVAPENKALPSSENMKTKVQSWIEEIDVTIPEPVTAQTLNAQEKSSSKDTNSHLLSASVNLKSKSAAEIFVNETADPNESFHADVLHLKTCDTNDFRRRNSHETKLECLHFEKLSTPILEEAGNLLKPQEISQFGEDLQLDPAELNLKLPTESMDFSQLGSVDLSHAESVNMTVEKVMDEQVKIDKAKVKQGKRRKRGHGAIDVEVFGYEESRQCKNSSRGQRLVPILKLPNGSSDEDDMSDKEAVSERSETEKHILMELEADNNEKTLGVVEEDFDMQHLSQKDAPVQKDVVLNQRSETKAWQCKNTAEENGQGLGWNEVTERGDAGPAGMPLTPEETTDDWKHLFDPSVAEDDQEETTSRLVEETEREEEPFLMQLVGKKSAKGKRPKSSKGKSVKSKVRQSIEKPGYQRKWARSSTAWSSYNPGELNTASSLGLSIDVQGQSSDRGLGQDLVLTNGNLSERSVSPARAVANKGRPSSADIYKRKQQKQRPVSAGLRKSRDRSRKRDKDEDLLYKLVEHRLPRKGIREMLLDRLTSPRSTYDIYLQMTPRIHEGTVSCWQCLPDEILINIFAYLNQSDLTHCAQVCHQFYRVAMDESLWKYITIKKKTDLDDSCLMEISKRHPVSLALIHCHGDQITAKGLRDMFRECAESLKELNISRCSRGALNGDSILLHAAARCHNITHIDTSWCNVTDSGLMAIANSCNRLESLCINGCQAISNDGLETIVKKHGDSLRVLEMFGCFNITPRGLQAVSNNCINLTSLHLGQCYKLTDSSIAQLSSSLGRVETLDLRGCKQIKDNCIRRVVKNCTRLKHLSLANCPNITDVSILEISTYLTDIRSIDLCGCKNITDSSLRALVNTCTNLRHIDISSTGCTHRSVSMIANFCAQRLESLKINFLSDVTEASLIKLAKHCRRLTSVHLYGCPSVKNLEKVKEEHPTFTVEM